MKEGSRDKAISVNKVTGLLVFFARLPGCVSSHIAWLCSCCRALKGSARNRAIGRNCTHCQSSHWDCRSRLEMSAEQQTNLGIRAIFLTQMKSPSQ